VSRANWRVLLTWHIAESREQPPRGGPGLMRWHNEYMSHVAAARMPAFCVADDAVDKTPRRRRDRHRTRHLVKIIKNLMTAPAASAPSSLRARLGHPETPPQLDMWRATWCRDQRLHHQLRESQKSDRNARCSNAQAKP